MPTFDLADVRGLAARIDARMPRVGDGRAPDDALREWAGLCEECREGMRAWGRAVFHGRAAFDPETERVWKAEADRLCVRAAELLSSGGARGDGRDVLEAALAGMRWLLDHWLTPQLAVAPGPRLGMRGLGTEEASEARRRLAALPPPA